MRQILDAIKLNKKGKVKEIGEGQGKRFFDVAGISVILEQEQSGKKLKCACKHCSIYSVFSGFCAFKLAVLYYLFKKGEVKDGKTKPE